MKIIEYGHIPESKLYRIECSYCHTIFEFTESEGKREFTSRNEDYLVINCPLCFEKIWIEQPPRNP